MESYMDLRNDCLGLSKDPVPESTHRDWRKPQVEAHNQSRHTNICSPNLHPHIARSGTAVKKSNSLFRVHLFEYRVE